MGRCRECGRSTPYPHNNGWCKLCFFFNYKEPRMYVSIVLTLFILQLPLIDENGIRAMLMKTLFEATGWQPFLLASIFINLVILGSTYLGVSAFLYKAFKSLTPK
jgi:hypothetical protein